MAKDDTCFSHFIKTNMRRIARPFFLYFLFGSFRLALKAPGQDKKFPNEFAERVSGDMSPTAVHTVRAYYPAMLLGVWVVDWVKEAFLH